MWFAGFATARISVPTPWQEEQSLGVPLKMALAWQDSHGRSRCLPMSSKPVVRWSKSCEVFGVAPGAPSENNARTDAQAASLDVIWIMDLSPYCR
jgi:hypothetical protein